MSDATFIFPYELLHYYIEQHVGAHMPPGNSLEFSFVSPGPHVAPSLFHLFRLCIA